MKIFHYCIVSVAVALLSATTTVYGQREQSTYTVGKVSFSMTHFSSQTFQMGATPEQGLDVDPNEKPVHEVSLSGFAIGETEVTQELWTAVMGDNPSLYVGKGFPVESVSYDDCLLFIKRLNAKTGESFRLPTEAEWECAARGGEKSADRKFGVTDDESSLRYYAWISENSEYQPHSVRQKGWSETRLYDMLGNMKEWCADWMGPYPSGKQRDPRGPQTGTERVCRGGGWGDVAWHCRTSSRSSHDPSYKASDLGFRLAMTLPHRSALYMNPVDPAQIKAEGLQLVSVEVTEKETRVHMIWKCYKKNGSCYIDRNAYLVDPRTGQHYPLQKADGIAVGSGRTNVGYGGTCDFVMYFPALPPSVTKVNFYESSTSTWNIDGIVLQ